MARERRLTKAEILEQLAAADARTAEADRTEPRARAATFDPVTRRVRIELKNGCAYEFPADLCQGLRGVSGDVLSQVEVYPYGIGLRWDALDIDFSIPGLVAGRFGNKAWMRQIESELADKDSAAESTPKANVTTATTKATRRVPRGRKAETDPAAAA
ncbi:DUF2442 domain-containing protein [Longimicrobium sp.]|jgi:hypothetical protein|uniref:DUF2442 domain-containing protein n=1 Tax=Longimicrobium sp. TaxID=2029185 RepID=UPI002ED960D5